MKVKAKNKDEVLEALDDCLLFINKRLDKDKAKDKEVKKKGETKIKNSYKSYMKVASIFVVCLALSVTALCVIKIPSVEQFIMTVLESFNINWGVDSARPTNFTNY